MQGLPVIQTEMSSAKYHVLAQSLVTWDNAHRAETVAKSRGAIALVFPDMEIEVVTPKQIYFRGERACSEISD